MQTDTSVLAALLGPIGTPELIIIAALGLLIFGRKLPEVGRSVGRAIVEFKRGLTEVKSDVDQAGSDKPIAPDASPRPGQSGGSAARTDQSGAPPA